MNRKIEFDGAALKLLAVLAMTADHIAWILFPQYPRNFGVLTIHIIGRFTAPVMWFFVAEGCFYTRNIRRYILRLFLLAAVSHFAYCFAFGIPFIPFKTSVFNQTSVIWGLAWGAGAVWLVDKSGIIKESRLKILAVLGICVLTFCGDWSCIPVLAVLGVYGRRGNLHMQFGEIMFYVSIYALVYFLFIDEVYGILQLFAAISFPFLARYNGKRGKKGGFKWFFYAYYPLHLVIIGVMRVVLYGNVGVMIGGV